MNVILGSVSAVFLWILAPNGPVVGQEPVQVAAANDSHGACVAATNTTDSHAACDVEGHINAVNYRVRGGPTRIDFKGTSLLPEGKGDAWIESKEGYTEINAKVDRLRRPATYGSEYMTYVLWAITPEGRVSNLGELVLDKGDRKAKIAVTTELQSFGLVVTAEPYFAVVRPSDVVVLENVVRKDTKGTVQEIEATFDLVKRGQYAALAANADDPASTPNVATVSDSNDIAQARNAINIATGSGAEVFSPDTMKKANLLLSQAETEQTVGSSKKASTFAREAVQTAEDARLVSMRRMAELRFMIERQTMIEREAALKALAIQEIERIAALAKQYVARSNEEVAKLEADRSRIEGQINTERMKAEAATRDAEEAREEARLAAEESRKAAQATLTADREKAELRANLRQQLGMILVTRDTVRGLIVDLGDVYFDTAQYTLKTGNRETLAKISGILMTFPDITIEVEGHTDNVGTAEYNKQLSQRRAESVREYLIQQGIPSDRITARGFGENQPVGSNASAEGRQQNRRVEMVVSGEALGTTEVEIEKQ